MFVSLFAVLSIARSTLHTFSIVISLFAHHMTTPQPIEHKWVVRILLGKLEIGLGKDPIFKHWHPYAADTHSANNNIKILAQKLADPEWIRRREEKDKLSNSNQMMEFE